MLRSPALRGILSIAVGAASMLAITSTTADAQPFACSAAADVTPIFCKSGGCNPADLQDGDNVPLTVELQNDSVYNGGGLTNPPKADTIQFTMRVYYSCVDATCAVVNPGDFTFVSASCAGACTFTNAPGMGYGTIDCPSGVLNFPAGDTAAKELCTIDLTANSPPGVGVIAALAGDPANDTSNQLIQLDEPTNCISNVIGGGQGSTSAAFGFVPGDLDSCDHANKQIIKLSGALNLGKGRLSIPEDCDPSTASFDIGYLASGGTFKFGAIGAGQLQKGGRCWNYRDKNAKSAGGIASLRICPMRSKPGRLCINYKGYGDIASVLGSNDMPIEVDACNMKYTGPATPIWNESPKKWILPRSVWP